MNTSLPEDILIKILSYLDPNSLKVMSYISHHFNLIISNSVALMDKLELTINSLHIDQSTDELKHLPYTSISVNYKQDDKPEIPEQTSVYYDHDRKCPYAMEVTDEEFEKLMEFELEVLKIIENYKNQFERVKVEFFSKDFLIELTKGMENIKSLHMKRVQRFGGLESEEELGESSKDHEKQEEDLKSQEECQKDQKLQQEDLKDQPKGQKDQKDTQEHPKNQEEDSKDQNEPQSQKDQKVDKKFQKEGQKEVKGGQRVQEDQDDHQGVQKDERELQQVLKVPKDQFKSQRSQIKALSVQNNPQESPNNQKDKRDAENNLKRQEKNSKDQQEVQNDQLNHQKGQKDQEESQRDKKSLKRQQEDQNHQHNDQKRPKTDEINHQKPLSFPKLIHITTEMATDCLDLINTNFNSIISLKFIEDVQKRMNKSKIAQKSSELTELLRRTQISHFYIQGFIPLIKLDFLPLKSLKIIHRINAPTDCLYYYEDEILNLVNICKSTLKDLKFISSPYGKTWRKIFDLNLKLEKLHSDQIDLPKGYNFPLNENLTELIANINCKDFETVKNFLSAHPNVQRLSIWPSFVTNADHHTDFLEHLSIAMPKLKHLNLKFPGRFILRRLVEIPSVETFVMNWVNDDVDVDLWILLTSVFPNVRKLKVDRWGYFRDGSDGFVPVKRRHWGYCDDWSDDMESSHSEIPNFRSWELEKILKNCQKIEELHIGRKFYLESELVDQLRNCETGLKKFVLHADDQQLCQQKFARNFERFNKEDSRNKNLQVVILRTVENYCDCGIMGYYATTFV